MVALDLVLEVVELGVEHRAGNERVDGSSPRARGTRALFIVAISLFRFIPTRVGNTAYRALPSVADDVRRYAASIIENTDVEIPPYRTLGLLTSRDAATVKALKGMDVSLYDYALDPYAVRHINGEHGNAAAELARGSRAVAPADYAMLPTILNGPDSIQDVGKSWSAGRPLILVRKRLGQDGPERPGPRGCRF